MQALAHGRFRIIVGVALIVFGSTLGLTASVFHGTTEAEVAVKRPELAESFYTKGFIRKRRLVEELYKQEFPDGRHILLSWLWAITGWLSFLLAAVALGFCK
jgi:hypothetical protein